MSTPFSKGVNWHSPQSNCRNAIVRRANLIACGGHYPRKPRVMNLPVKDIMLCDNDFAQLPPLSQSALDGWVRPGTSMGDPLPTASVSEQGANRSQTTSNESSSTWLLPISISTDSIYTILAISGPLIPAGVSARTSISPATSPGESISMPCTLSPSTEVDTARLSRIDKSCNPSGTSTRDGASVDACIQSGLQGAPKTSQSESHGMSDDSFATTMSTLQGSLPSTNKQGDSNPTISTIVSTKTQTQSASTVSTNISWISIEASEPRPSTTASSTAHGANISGPLSATKTTSSSSPSAVPLESGTPIDVSSTSSSAKSYGHTLSIAVPISIITFLILIALLLLLGWRRVHKDSYNRHMPRVPGYNTLHRWSNTRTQNRNTRRSRALYSGDNDGFLDDTYERHRRRYEQDLLKTKAKRSLEMSTTSLARNRGSIAASGTNARDGGVEHGEVPATPTNGLHQVSVETQTSALVKNSAAETDSMESWEEKWHSFGRETQQAQPIPE
ncbi:hypothetical protein LTR84_012119 [Exophiala bonariae]|uniref:Uncharacterized protein n=1 Tax=Exophiala bonariae TaxID=1690606 RepID=A0AAV9NGJ1_9EURO|nr:hypothetical protein LTR84_012119 [Exophiala bonariae]